MFFSPLIFCMQQCCLPFITTLRLSLKYFHKALSASGQQKGEKRSVQHEAAPAVQMQMRSGDRFSPTWKISQKSKMPILLRPDGHNNTIGKLQTFYLCNAGNLFPQDKPSGLSSQGTRTKILYNLHITQDPHFVNRQTVQSLSLPSSPPQ